MQQIVRKKGRGGGSGKAIAPHPDELIGVSPPPVESQKPGSGRKTIDLLKLRAGKAASSQEKVVPGKKTIDLLKLRAGKGPQERSISPAPVHCQTSSGKKPAPVGKCVKPESVGSTTKEETGSTVSSSVEPKQCSPETGLQGEVVKEESHKQEGGGGLFSVELHTRLSLLEDRVTQLASELRDTKQLLHASHPMSNQVLTDIQSKISNIEKVIVSRGIEGGRRELTTSCGLSQESTIVTLEEKSDSEGRKSNTVSVHESLLTVADEFLASLKCSQAAKVPSTSIEVKALPLLRCGNDSSVEKSCVASTIRTGTSEKRRRHSLSDNRSSGSYKSANTSASDVAFEALVGLECDEVLSEDVTEDQENAVPAVNVSALELPVDDTEPELCQLGSKSVLAGWFVYEAEGMLLAHDDGSCSFYDVANMEEKSQYKLPEELVPSTWRDCWLIRAAGMDGRSCKYVVAASAGTAVDPAFCSWNFYEKTVAAYRSETPSWPTTPHSNRSSSPESRRSSKDTSSLGSGSTQGHRFSESKGELDFPLWWYTPCGPLIACGGSGLKTLTLYDIRDGDRVMNWDSKRCLSSTMSYSSPLQWRSRGTLIAVEDKVVTAWDVSNAEAQCVHTIDLAGNAPRAVHIYNIDGECNGGVRQRINSKNIDGIVGVVATQEAVSILDFRVPSGIAVKIPTLGQDVHSLYAHGEAVYAAGTIKSKCTIQQWSIRKGQPMMLYTLPKSVSSHHLHTQISQVWGDKSSVMAVNGNGLFVFDASTGGACGPAVIGSDDLYCPTFDYSGSKVLLISRDRPACWQYWPTTPLWNLSW
ncbi:KIN14B-interacting protein At4g14310-like isoform X1 [Selaginella moellendorffii]|uniref:KIN14B-interacting protein At4g14310-like isoform X1 n=2 Tax=Selaginella moellendorffii TaxID=88036 RepID=UPI000D1C986D|nr:KIN14B-interacting protein At4g14310-like isoform X1 [Selaginella moellendorffii]|eukprot:XP_024537631.1 KIN14B-interacting protein At4g14310-like isoform X1 [Selaginella moellendorffii]